jgi:broad specificity phosphatase PhoE
MSREYASLRRKTFFLPFLIGGVLSVAVLVVGFWLHGRIVTSASATLVVVTRHAEKDLSGGEDPSLTAEGMARAARLAASFPGRAGQLGFDRVYVTQWRRSVETARPTLAQSGALLSRVEADAPAALVQQIRTQDVGRRVLVVAHSDTVPAIVHGLVPTAQIPEIASTEYGTVYVIAVPRTGQATVLAMHIP